MIALGTPLRHAGARLLAVTWLLAGTANPTQAQAPNGFGINENTPIEVTADAFEVRPKNQVGVFEGNVKAIQGLMTVAADRIEVYYTEDGSAGEGQSISRMEARGSVRITSPEEQATGAWARYDVAAQEMVLGGGVLLTRGPNVLEGARLTINLASNVSRLTPYGDTGEPAAEVGPSKGRVRAVFTPPSQSDKDPD